MIEEISGGPYPRGDVNWTTVEADGSWMTEEALSAAPRGWWRCPNDPPCPHPGVVHDIDEWGGIETCCMEGCDCGKSPATPGVAGPPKDQT